jgi:hypothetical protein
MKISLWQQFSSNHSGFFWVVGTFASLAEARNAYEKLREMLITIDQWHQEHPDKAHKSIDPLPPEREFAIQYGVEWPLTIDWTGWAAYKHSSLPENYARKTALHLIDDAIFILGRTVVAHNPDQTWMSQQPFEGILANLGAQTMGYDLESLEQEGWPESHLIFTTPDIATANRLEEGINAYLAGDLASLDNPPPWNEDQKNYAQVLGKSTLLDPNIAHHLQRQWQTRATSPFTTPYIAEMPAKRLALNGKPQIRREGLRFMFANLNFHNDLLGQYALIAWLEVNDCTEIDYFYIRARD